MPCCAELARRCAALQAQLASQGLGPAVARKSTEAAASLAAASSAATQGAAIPDRLGRADARQRPLASPWRRSCMAPCIGADPCPEPLRRPASAGGRLNGRGAALAADAAGVSGGSGVPLRVAPGRELQSRAVRAALAVLGRSAGQPVAGSVSGKKQGTAGSAGSLALVRAPAAPPETLAVRAGRGPLEAGLLSAGNPSSDFSCLPCRGDSLPQSRPSGAWPQRVWGLKGEFGYGTGAGSAAARMAGAAVQRGSAACGASKPDAQGRVMWELTAAPLGPRTPPQPRARPRSFAAAALAGSFGTGDPDSNTRPDSGVASSALRGVAGGTAALRAQLSTPKDSPPASVSEGFAKPLAAVGGGSTAPATAESVVLENLSNPALNRPAPGVLPGRVASLAASFEASPAACTPRPLAVPAAGPGPGPHASGRLDSRFSFACGGGAGDAAGRPAEGLRPGPPAGGKPDSRFSFACEGCGDDPAEGSAEGSAEGLLPSVSGAAPPRPASSKAAKQRCASGGQRS